MKNELVVLKVGTSTLEQQHTENRVALDHESFSAIALQATELMLQGTAVAIVSSGAIAAGYERSGSPRTAGSKIDMVERQRLASIGQSRLMRAWEDAFTNSQLLVAQVLFTRNELRSNEARELSAVAQRSIERGDILIANENDALSHEEISFGDNDRLAAHFAALLHGLELFDRTRLVILSDIHGVYEDKNNAQTVIPEIHDTTKYQHLAGGANSSSGTGGMATKFMAAEIAAQAGIDIYITHGRTPHSIQRALNGKIGTRFIA